MDAALPLLAGSVHVGVDTGTTAVVLGLVELIVDDVLEHEKQNADEDREDGDANVCLQVPFLEAEVLAEERVGLRQETRGAPPRIHGEDGSGLEEAEAEAGRWGGGDAHGGVRNHKS